MNPPSTNRLFILIAALVALLAGSLPVGGQRIRRGLAAGAGVVAAGLVASCWDRNTWPLK